MLYPDFITFIDLACVKTKGKAKSKVQRTEHSTYLVTFHRGIRNRKDSEDSIGTRHFFKVHSHAVTVLLLKCVHFWSDKLASTLMIKPYWLTVNKRDRVCVRDDLEGESLNTANVHYLSRAVDAISWDKHKGKIYVR